MKNNEENMEKHKSKNKKQKKHVGGKRTKTKKKCKHFLQKHIKSQNKKVEPFDLAFEPCLSIGACSKIWSSSDASTSKRTLLFLRNARGKDHDPTNGGHFPSDMAVWYVCFGFLSIQKWYVVFLSFSHDNS